MKNESKQALNKGALLRSLRIFRYVLPHRVKFVLGMFFLLLSAVTFMTFPGLIGRLVGGNEVQDSPIDRFFNLENIDQVALLLMVAFVLQGFFSYMRIYLFADFTEKAIAAIRQDTYNHLIQLPMTFFSSHRVGELNSRISNDISQLQEVFMTTMAELVRQLIIIVFGVGLLFFYSTELTLVMLCSLPIMMLGAMVFGKFIRKLSKKTQATLAESQVIVEETLQGIQNVKAFGNEYFESKRYLAVTENVRQIAMKSAKWRGAFASFIITGLFGAIVLVIWYGVKLKNEGEIGMDVLMSFILYSVFVGGSIGGVADVFGKVQKAIGSTESLFDLMEEGAEEIDTSGIRSGLPILASIELSNVNFSYPSRSDVHVIRDLSFNVEQGQKVAIVGASGAGKSTILSLLFRFFEPNGGEILIGGKPSTSYSISELRSHFALVPQEILLFGGSIRENIAYGKPNASEQEIIAAAEKANALEFIRQFPEGLETLVGERGIQLSGGQRQRIAIARAILKNPQFLVLDEATSSLDSENERLVQDALELLMKDRTSVIIAHRLSTIRNADKIVVLENGSAAEQGTHEELMKIENGLYRKMSEMQQSA